MTGKIRAASLLTARRSAPSGQSRVRLPSSKVDPLGWLREAKPIPRCSFFTMSKSAVFFPPGALLPPGSLAFSSHLSSRPAPSEGEGGAPGGVPALNFGRAGNARRHACGAWALPRNREARLAALRRGVVGPAPASVPALPPAPARRPLATGHCCRAAGPGLSCPRLRAAVDATSRAAFGESL
jgi:hypothetical protein